MTVLQAAEMPICVIFIFRGKVDEAEVGLLKIGMSTAMSIRALPRLRLPL